ncbi:MULTISPECIES: AbrB/MazE/SpoVT family DNA-binding domain-containing protein [unclassified Methylobacterium]|uniref:AbrB/MazE/SpoVT family DNA-binding domain-containing protein n=1 Tax=unclassified Methylobacterium TaxID=2615210 RepID=UPI001FEDB20E|nr:AbrB/MazE/SpoVT family DNA-binding domain-containing protein [Methylobacterium sp. 2A]
MARVRLVKTETETGQRLDIPPGFVLGGEEALLRQDRARLVLEPVCRPSLLSVLDGLADLDETWPDIADPVPEDVRL